MLPDPRLTATLHAARRLLQADAEDEDARLSLASVLRVAPDLAEPCDQPALQSLLADPMGDPALLEQAGWALLREAGLPDAGADPAGTARWLEESAFARTLLAETRVTILPVERSLTALRRWLLLGGNDASFPLTVAALVRQAALNGGAWPFDAAEREALRADASMTPAYLPPRPATGAADAAFAAPVTRAVAAQYEAWPYPSWTRAVIAPGDTLASRLAALGPDAPPAPSQPEILVAGCGTGREAALWARRVPEGRVTAIDLSAASLHYAAERCRDLPNIDFVQLDLHDVAALGRRFDLIACSGVLHHLPAPETGWAALVDVLAPGGVMHVMLYSKLARMLVASARHRIADLLGRPVDDDLLREARARLMADPLHDITSSPDFHDLGGVHDLLFHAHEDAFDVPRIRRAIDHLGLQLLRFDLRSARARRWYKTTYPDDPWQRDYEKWAAIERRNPGIFAGMYRFWCVRRGDAA